MYLAPGAGYTLPDLDATVGASLVRRDGKTIVLSVYSESPADRAGIRVNDELIEAAGTDTSELAIGKIRRLVQMELLTKGKVAVGLRRSEKNFVAMLRNERADLTAPIYQPAADNMDRRSRKCVSR
jgi:C-terminal processing protease CtpA/Prc